MTANLTHKRILVLLLAATCIVEGGILVRRFVAAPDGSERQPHVGPAKQQGETRVGSLDQAVTISGFKERPPHDHTRGPEAIASNEAKLGAETNAVDTEVVANAQAELDVPEELRYSPEFVSLMQRLKDQGGDLWLLAQMANTQFERQKAIWQRAEIWRSSDRVAMRQKVDQYRWQLIASLLGPEAVNRFQFRNWIRHEWAVVSRDINRDTALALYRLEREQNEANDMLRQSLTNKEISLQEFEQRYRALWAEYQGRKDRMLQQAGVEQ
jgi:hypothetical protein